MVTSPNVQTGAGSSPPPRHPPAATPARGRMSISNLTAGKIATTGRILLYGPEGIGKTLWPSKAPSPAYLCSESGTETYDLPRIPTPHTWDDVFDALRSLHDDTHDRKTLVVDTIDWLEPMCWSAVCEKAGKKDIEEFGYGKGYVAALDEWRRFLSELERLRRDRKMWIVLLAHSWIKPFKNPTGEDFDRYQLKLHEKASGLIKEWSDAVLFANFETFALKKDPKSKTERAKGSSSGARFVNTQRTAAWDAKNRYSLPEKMPLDWDDFAAAVAAGAPEDPATLRVEIAEMVKDADPTLAAKVADAVTKAGEDAASLARIKDRLGAKLAQKDGQ